MVNDWQFIHDRAQEANDLGYANFIAKFPLSFYLKRLRNIEFINQDLVLDIGCGFGQWSYGLAHSNERVVALEKNKSRLNIAKSFFATEKILNVEFVESDAVSLPFSDATFDLLFCYGVYMFLPQQPALQEFHRVLKPGGKLYICTNGPGWWLELGLKNIFKNFSLAKTAFKSFISKPLTTIPGSLSCSDIPKILTPDLWENFQVDLEGCLGNQGCNRNPDLLAYPGKYKKYDAVIEFVATKKSNKLIKTTKNTLFNQAKQLLNNCIDKTLLQTAYNYYSGLEEYHYPQPALDLVNNNNYLQTHKALLFSDVFSVQEILVDIFHKITQGYEGAKEKFLACLGFTQKHFYHPFAGQPMEVKNHMVFDPIASLLLGQGRCGVAARFLIDLLMLNGYDARLITAACHTSAEVLIEDKWVLADASLYPPGIYPCNDKGELLSLSEAIQNPELLDLVPSYINYHHSYIEKFLSRYPETYEAIGHYLQQPILPSVAFFGAEYFIERGRKIRCYKKSQVPRLWTKHNNFGWSDLHEEESLQIPVIQSMQRPQQVLNLRIHEKKLVWEQKELNNTEIYYKIMVSNESRGWSYNAIPVNCRFLTQGMEFKTKNKNFPIKELLQYGTYVTVYAELANRPNVFYLPSEEYKIKGDNNV